jgi:hypothetical protein
MYDERDTHSLKRPARKLGALGRGRGRHGLSKHVREINAAFFEDLAPAYNAAYARASGLAVPFVGNLLSARVDLR